MVCVNAIAGVPTDVLERKQFQMVHAETPDQPEAEWSRTWIEIAKRYLENLGYRVTDALDPGPEGVPLSKVEDD